jgi:hypothetical protein
MGPDASDAPQQLLPMAKAALQRDYKSCPVPFKKNKIG